MDETQFDRWTQTLSARITRRSFGRLGVGVLGMLGIARSAVSDTEAKKKKKQPKKKKGGAAPTCTPACTGKVCGGNGCGGSCGSCAGTRTCTAEGQCVCTPNCQGKECGSDGCTGNCGACTTDETCSAAGRCACKHETCGGSCCGTDQVCDVANACCSPETQQTTCQGTCGSVVNNCDQPVECGGCTGPATCGGGGTPNVCGVNQGGICPANADYCAQPSGAQDVRCSVDGTSCTCVKKLNGSSFCGTFTGACAACASDNDCVQTYGYMQGTACVAVTDAPHCGCVGTACIPPCPNPA